LHTGEVGDPDGAGDPDVVASEFRGQGRLLVFDNLGRARAWAALTIARGQDLHNTRVADVNGEGLPDVFGAAPFGDNPVVLYESSRIGATRVLVFSKTLGFRHDSIPHAIGVLKHRGAAHVSTVDGTEDARAFSPANLVRYRAVVFLNPSGN